MGECGQRLCRGSMAGEECGRDKVGEKAGTQGFVGHGEVLRFHLSALESHGGCESGRDRIA